MSTDKSPQAVELVDRAMEEGSGSFSRDVGSGSHDHHEYSSSTIGCHMIFSVPFMQKIIAEIFGTYFMIFAGCASVVVDQRNGVITFPGICITWGLVVMVLVYSLGHISGAHFNPAVTIAFATCKRLPWKQVPGYIAAQVMGSTLASVTLLLMFGEIDENYFGTTPAGSHIQSLAIEFIISFYLMLVVSGVATDNRAVGELAGLAVGAVVLVNVLFAGTISGASMNPGRSLGPAIVANKWKGFWVYVVGPISGTISGAWAYNLIRFTDKSLGEITSKSSFFKSLRRAG